MTPKTAYRLAVPERWAAVMMEGVFSGDPHDVADGFIHLSAADQVEGTLVKHYNEHERLLLVEIGERLAYWEARSVLPRAETLAELAGAAVKLGRQHERAVEVLQPLILHILHEQPSPLAPEHRPPQ